MSAERVNARPIMTRCSACGEIADLQYRCFTCQPRPEPGWLARSLAEPRKAKASRADTAYWRNAYETLVKQTGRDLNDGLGLDPRKAGS